MPAKRKQPLPVLVVSQREDGSSVASVEVDLGGEPEQTVRVDEAIKDLIDPRFVTKISSTPYRVAMVDFDALGLSPEDEEGLCLPHKALILISRQVPPVRRQDVFWHEFVHGTFAGLGPKQYAHLVGCKQKDAYDSEERLACFLGPILCEALRKPAIDEALA